MSTRYAYLLEISGKGWCQESQKHAPPIPRKRNIHPIMYLHLSNPASRNAHCPAILTILSRSLLAVSMRDDQAPVSMTPRLPCVSKHPPIQLAIRGQAAVPLLDYQNSARRLRAILGVKLGCLKYAARCRYFPSVSSRNPTSNP